MPVITINTEFSFDVADIEDDVIEREVKRRDGVHKKLMLEWEDEQDPPSAHEFKTSELMDVLEERDVDLRPWMERCYRMIAMGENDDALDLIYREYGGGLAPPSTEKRTAARLVQGASLNVEN